MTALRLQLIDAQAISKALLQNRDLKRQIEEVESRFVTLTTDNMQLTTDLQAATHQKCALLPNAGISHPHTAAELGKALARAREEHSTKAQADADIIASLQDVCLHQLARSMTAAQRLLQNEAAAAEGRASTDALAALRHDYDALQAEARRLELESAKARQSLQILTDQGDQLRLEHQQQIQVRRAPCHSHGQCGR